MKKMAVVTQPAPTKHNYGRFLQTVRSTKVGKAFLHGCLLHETVTAFPYNIPVSLFWL